MSTHKPNLWVILFETSRVIRAHSLHFLALSALFIFPMSISTIMYPFLMQPNSVNSDYNQKISPAGKSQLLFPVLHSLFLSIFSLCASASITFTTFHGFHGRPVSFISSLKSILVSFFPLLATHLLVGSVIFAFIILMLLSYNAISLLGFVMDYNNDYFLVFVILFSTLVIALLVYLQVEWCLSTAVVVLEDKWGFASFRRSSYLVKGVRGAILSLLILFGILIGLLSFWYLNLLAGFSHGQTSWCVFVLQMAVYAVFSTILTLYSVAAITVLFIYCKDLHGELAFEAGLKFGSEYVRLPPDDGVDASVFNVV